MERAEFQPEWDVEKSTGETGKAQLPFQWRCGSVVLPGKEALSHSCSSFMSPLIVFPFSGSSLGLPKAVAVASSRLLWATQSSRHPPPQLWSITLSVLPSGLSLC